MAAAPLIHTCTSSPAGADVNAYLVEMPAGIVAIDSMLTVSDSRALRQRLEALRKPLLAVLLTHSHPDHYGGLSELVAGNDVPVMATQGVHDVIRRDDAVKESILRPMLGDEWAQKRTFPNTVVADGETVELEGTTFTAIDLGPSESPHDSLWLLGDDDRTVFLGDQIYDRKHCYLADGFYAEWLTNIAKLRDRFPADAVFYIGHGGPVGVSNWSWQNDYIERFIEAVSRAEWSNPDAARTEVVAAMKEYEPGDNLQFLMELSIEPLATKLGLVGSA